MEVNDSIYKLIFKRSNDGIIGVDPNTLKIKIANPTFCRMLKYPQNELINSKISKIHPRKEFKNVLKQFDLQIKGKIKIAANIPLLLKNKKIIYCDVNSELIKVDGKELLVGIFRDVTQKKHFEEELIREHDFSENLINTAEVIIVVLDKNGKIVKYNPFMEKVTGVKLKKAKGKDWFSTFLPKGDYTKIRKIFRKTFEKTHSRGIINPILDVKGNEIVVEWSNRTIIANNGDAIGLLAVGQVVTDKLEVQRQLNASIEKYKSIFNTVTHLITSVDSKGVIVDCNDRIFEYLGYRKSEIIGNSMAKIIHPSYMKKAQKSLKEILSKGISLNKEYVMVKKNKEEIYVNINSAGIKDELGKFTKTICVIEDITKRKETEKLLSRNKESLEQAQEIAKIGRWKYDVITEKLTWSKGVFKIMKIPKKEFDGTLAFFQKFIHKDDFGNVMKAYNNSIKKKKPYDIIHRIIRPNGEIRYVREKCKTKYDSKGKPYESIGIIQDVTLLKRAEEKAKDFNLKLKKKVKDRTRDLEKANIDISKLLGVKTQFVNQVAHDLRTPLTPVYGLLPIIKSNLKNEKDIERMDVVINNVKYLNQIVKDTLNISRLDSGKNNFELKKCNIVEIIDEIIKNNKFTFDKNNVKVTKEIQKGNHYAWCDKIKVIEVLQNLISNSVNFLINKKREIKITVHDQKNTIAVCVIDNGIGIDKKNEKKVFEEFFKVDSSRHEHSSGLGLAICKRIVEGHGGKIWAKSRGENKGLKICFTLKKNKKEVGCDEENNCCR